MNEPNAGSSIRQPATEREDHRGAATEVGSLSVLFQGKTMTVTRNRSWFELALHRAPINEIGTETLTDLEHALDKIQLALNTEPGTPVIVYSSLDRGFCAGADLRELHARLVKERNKGTAEEELRRNLADFIDRIHHAFNLLDQFSCTTIAALHGFCFGGGWELALTCDLLVADRSTRFCFPELRLGIIPGFGGIPRLRRDLGNAVLRDIILTGRSLSAKRSFEAGLASQLTGRGKALEVARTLAEQVAKLPPSASIQAKRFLKPLPRQELEEEKTLFLDQILHPNVQSALSAFVDRSDPLPYIG
ncbi:MAG: enoyl-CoA hydratase/isomerase family protein [Myxococcota bacterium]